MLKNCSKFNICVGSCVPIRKGWEIEGFILKDGYDVSCSLAKVISCGYSGEWYLLRKKFDGI